MLRGIGSVQAYNTVTVKSRVDGNIVRVACSEGQYVKKGEMLVQIDPRPYQAQLETAQANKVKDEANLEDANLNLSRYDNPQLPERSSGSSITKIRWTPERFAAGRFFAARAASADGLRSRFSDFNGGDVRALTQQCPRIQ